MGPERAGFREVSPTWEALVGGGGGVSRFLATGEAEHLLNSPKVALNVPKVAPHGAPEKMGCGVRKKRQEV